jgi:nucleotide-binding universal stress UspA family protein
MGSMWPDRVQEKKGCAMYKHILVPTDGSELSREAARAAVAFARSAGARITAFHAKPEARIAYYVEGMRIDESVWRQSDEVAESAAQECLRHVETLCLEAGVSCTKLTKACDMPYQAIIEAATERGCDLIFMASHGRHGISALLLGSETGKVLTHSKIPVLVYR